MSFILTFDLGGSGLRAALLARDGSVVGLQTVAIEASLASAIHEVDPLKWWRALIEAVEAVGRASPEEFGKIDAIAITGFTRSQVLIDKDGHAVRPALLFADTRAQDSVERLLSLLPATHPERVQINAYHPLARLFWLSHHEQTAFERTWLVLEPKDYLNYRLTGAAITDVVSSARLLASLARGKNGRSAMEAAQLPHSLMPNHKDPASVAGTVRPDLPGRLAWLKGKPVITMGNDTWASVLGLGALRPGYAYNLTGTTEVLGLVSRHGAVEAHGLLTVNWGAGMTQLGGPSLAGGDTVKWFVNLFRASESVGKTAQATMEAILRPARQDNPLLFLPYLQGERTPHWNPSLRGAFLGLERQHGPGDMFHAVLEGVAFLNRSVLERAEQAIGEPAPELRFGGGGAGNAMWRQIKADVLNRPIVVPNVQQAGLLGASIAARTAIGQFDDLVAAQDALQPATTRTLPDPSKRAFYDRLFAIFQQAETAVAPISEQLANWKQA